MNTRAASLAVLALALLHPGLSAQSSSYESATVSLQVYSDLILTKISDLNLGITSSGTVRAVASTSAEAGKFTLGGQAGVPLMMSYPSSVSLTSGSNAPLSFSPTLSGFSGDMQGSSTAISSGSTVTTGASGAYYVWLGGSTNVAAVQPTGTYAGIFTLSVAY